MYNKLCSLVQILLGKLFKLNEIPKSFSGIFTPEKLLPIKNQDLKEIILNNYEKLQYLGHIMRNESEYSILQAIL